ncbi:MAG: DNA-processing protein DprA [Bacteroidales bacterium]
MDKDEKICLVALNQILNNNDKKVKELLSHSGSAEALFILGKSKLLKHYGKDHKFIQDISNPNTLIKAKEEIKWANNEGIEILCYSDTNSGYPSIMLEYVDYPIVLYKKGDFCLNSNKLISIVGTRKATSYGKTICNEIVRDMAKIIPDAAIVSGLAYGIDIAAHKAALENNLPTVAVLGSGLDNIYPVAHASIANKICENGAVITEFCRQNRSFKINFLQRNRIIAGISHALIVVESKERGGSMITANLAKEYFTEVFAVPGKLSDPYSAGCNLLISEQNAMSFHSALKFAINMNWYTPKSVNPNLKSISIWPPDSEKEKILVALNSYNELNIDNLLQITELPALQLSSLLLDLELEGRIISLPGKRYSSS